MNLCRPSSFITAFRAFPALQRCVTEVKASYGLLSCLRLRQQAQRSHKQDYAMKTALLVGAQSLR